MVDMPWLVFMCGYTTAGPIPPELVRVVAWQRQGNDSSRLTGGCRGTTTYSTTCESSTDGLLLNRTVPPVHTWRYQLVRMGGTDG